VQQSKFVSGLTVYSFGIATPGSCKPMKGCPKV